MQFEIINYNYNFVFTNERNYINYCAGLSCKKGDNAESTNV